MITTTPLRDLRNNKTRKKVKLERKKIRKDYIKVIMRKKFLENTERLHVQWTHDEPKTSEGDITESFGEQGYLTYTPQN
jgi:hypothetical protein